MTTIGLRITVCMLTLAGLMRTAAAQEPRPLDEGTRRMAERLDAIAKSADPRAFPWMNSERAVMFRNDLQHVTELQDAFNLRTQLAMELLAAGELPAAAKEFHGLRRFLEQPNVEGPEKSLRSVREALAVCYLRGSRWQSARTPPSIDAFLIPLRGPTATTEQEIIIAAINELTGVLKEKPDDVVDRWLLNLGYMAVAGYPEKVPSEWLIPAKAFESEFTLPRFRDAAPAIGLESLGRAGGSILDDFDGDGLLDVMVSSMGLRDPLRFYRNQGDGGFVDRSQAAGIIGLLGGINLAHADYNNDGRLDVFVLRGGWCFELGLHPDSLLKNNGDGTFGDVTEEAGLLTLHPNQVAVWGDYNNDGWVDLFVGNESDPEHIHPCQLFHNKGDGTFEERGAALGLDVHGYVKGAAWGDYNNDGRIDLYISRLAQPNLLLRNDGPGSDGSWKFSDVTEEAGVAAPIQSLSTWFWDFDNDGWLDLLVAPAAGLSMNALHDVASDYAGLPTKAERPRLYKNNRSGTFTDVTVDARLNRVIPTAGAGYGDLDNDGFPDCYFVTGEPDPRAMIPNRMFRNAGGRTFQDVTTAGGFGHLQMGNGVSFADIDNDGDQDLYVAVGGFASGDVARRVLFENPGSANHWITLRLEGKKSNRSAIGARIRVTVTTAERRTRDIHSVVASGGGSGSPSLQQEIGLGDAKSIDSVEVQWPGSATPQTYRDVPMDRIVRLREGESKAEPLDPKPIKLKPAATLPDAKPTAASPSAVPPPLPRGD